MADALNGRDRVAVLLDEIAELDAKSANPSDSVSTDSIIEALDTIGFEPIEITLRMNEIDEWLREILAGDFKVAFNLCESVGGISSGEHLPAAAVELIGLPKTGASAATLLYCLDKDLCSALLRSRGITVPEWTYVEAGESVSDSWDIFPAIAKPAAEDASNGVHLGSVANDRAELDAAIGALHRNWNGVLVQEYIDGREINLAVVGRHLLPPAEIDFSDMPEDAPQIVTFAGKWVEGSPDDIGTQPVCPAPLDRESARALQKLAGRVWGLMGGEGYGRVDVRLNESGVPYVIDVNPNPDLSPDAGLARQARVSGWTYEELIAAIVQEALDRERKLNDGTGEQEAGLAEPAASPGVEWVILEPVEEGQGARG